MASANLGKVIEKMIGRIRKEAKAIEEAPLSAPSAPTAHPTPPSHVARSKVYLKSTALHSLEDLDKVKGEVKLGNILIVRVGPLAEKNLDDVRRAVGELCEFAEQIGGDIARLGEERVVVTPSFVRIWREKTAQSGSETPTEAE